MGMVRISLFEVITDGVSRLLCRVPNAVRSVDLIVPVADGTLRYTRLHDGFACHADACWHIHHLQWSPGVSS